MISYNNGAHFQNSLSPPRLLLRKTGKTSFNSFLACVQSLLCLSVSLVSICQVYLQATQTMQKIQLAANLLVFYNAFLYILLGEKSVFPVLRYTVFHLQFHILSEFWRCLIMYIIDLHIRNKVAVITQKKMD